jgi:autonomous glycyl radical cofactor GrcA
MENAILISVNELTTIIQNSIKVEIEPIMQILGDKKISVTAAADLLGVTTRTLYRFRSEYPELKYSVVGRTVKYSLHDVLKFKCNYNNPK